MILALLQAVEENDDFNVSKNEIWWVVVILLIVLIVAAIIYYVQNIRPPR